MSNHNLKHRRIGAAVVFLAVAVAMAFAVRAAVAEVYVVPTGVVEPEVPRGARILVLKLTSVHEPGQIIAYHDNDRTLLGRFAGYDATGHLRLSRNAGEITTIDPEAVVGRVVVTTR